MSVEGYRPDFLGDDFVFDMPTITAQQASNINWPTAQETPELSYLNYSVVMNRVNRQALFSAANADFNENVGEWCNFRPDGRIENLEQLENIHYEDLDGVENRTTEGHLTPATRFPGAPPRNWPTGQAKTRATYRT